VCPGDGAGNRRKKEPDLRSAEGFTAALCTLNGGGENLSGKGAVLLVNGEKACPGGRRHCGWSIERGGFRRGGRIPYCSSKRGRAFQHADDGVGGGANCGGGQAPPCLGV